MSHITDNPERFMRELELDGELPSLINSALINDDWERVIAELKYCAARFALELDSELGDPDHTEKMLDDRDRALDINSTRAA